MLAQEFPRGKLNEWWTVGTSASAGTGPARNGMTSAAGEQAAETGVGTGSGPAWERLSDDERPAVTATWTSPGSARADVDGGEVVAQG